VNDSGREVSLSLNRAEALVFFEWLAREDGAGSLSFAHPAEEQVLWRVEAQLEKCLADVFAPDYTARLAEARRSVLAPDPR